MKGKRIKAMFNSRPFLKPARPGIRKRELLLRKGLNWKKWTAGCRDVPGAVKNRPLPSTPWRRLA
jgi:hypothetical protein